MYVIESATKFSHPNYVDFQVICQSILVIKTHAIYDWQCNEVNASNQKVPSLFTLIYINNLFQSTFVVSYIKMFLFPKESSKKKKAIMITQAGFIW